MSRVERLVKNFGYEGNGGCNQKKLKAMRESARRLEASQGQKEKKKPDQGFEPNVLPAGDDELQERHGLQVLKCLSHLQNRIYIARELRYLDKHRDLMPPQLSHIEIPEISPGRRLSNAFLQRLGLRHY